jgi:hypothetical protein
MTVSDTTARTSAVGTNTAGQQIPFTFPVSATSELLVKTKVTATGVPTILVETTDYSVSLVNNGLDGGTVSLVAALATTSECHVRRNTTRDQQTDLKQGGAFSADNVETGLDKQCKLAINNGDLISRCLQMPDTDDGTLDMTIPNSVDRADGFLGFNASGEPTVTSSVTPATATVTAFMETVLDDASAAAARTTLGVVIGTDVQAYDADLTIIGALAKTDGNFIVANGSAWVAESGATARTSLGAAAAADVVNITETVFVDNNIVAIDNEIVIAA